MQTGRHGGLAWIKLHGPAGPAEEGRVSSLHHRQGHFGRGQDIGSGGGIIYLLQFNENKLALLWGEAQLCLPYVC